MFNVKKILWLTLILALGFNIFSFIYTEQNEFPQNSTYHNNIQTGEEFLYNNTMKSYNVFVGSSISRGIGFGLIKKGINLSFTGTSCIEGLSLIQHKTNKPSKIFIEINTLYALPYEGLLKEILYLKWLKQKLPSFRQNQKPLKIILKLILSLRDWTLSKVAFFTKAKKGKKLPSDYLNVKKLQDQYVDAITSSDIDTALVRTNIKELEKQLSIHMEFGTEIYLLEFPVHENILNSPRHLYLVNAIKKIQPKYGFNFLFFKNEDYSWSDGLHMTEVSSIRFQKELAIRIKDLELKNNL